MKPEQGGRPVGSDAAPSELARFIFFIPMMKRIQPSENKPIPRASANDAVGDGARRHRRRRSGKRLQGAFTRYVVEIARRGEATAEGLENLWQALSAATIRELRRRSLWTSPPSYLGVCGWRSWWERSPGPGRTASALDELVIDCFSEIFVKRLPRLLNQLEVKPEIDGLVFIYLRNYIHDRRKAHDPMGFRLFQTLRMAVRQAVAAGELFVVAGDSKILNGTVVATRPDEARRPAADPRRLRSIVERWNDELFPGIMRVKGTERQILIGRLRDRFRELEAHGARVFRFKDLIDSLKRDVRARWAALFELERGESVLEESKEGLATVVRLIRPDERLEERESFATLVARVADRLDRLDAPVKTRRYLRALWSFLGSFASDDNLEALPSNRKLSDLLAIPRERLPGLYDTLRAVVANDRGALTMPFRIAGIEADPAAAASGRPP